MRPADSVVRSAVAVVIVGALVVVGLLDYRTGPYFSLALLYVTLVLVAAWWLGQGPALLAALVAGLAWFWAEAIGRRGEPREELMWNAGTRLVMLLAMVAMIERIRSDRERLREINARLAKLLSGAEHLARTDPLTDLPNRRAFIERLSDELARAQRASSPVCIAYVDIDNFKRVNDEKGHPAGDAYLLSAARAIRETVRASDVSARLGGDEFAVLFTDAKRSAVEPLAHRLLAQLQKLGETHPGLDLGASIGMAWFEHAPDSPEALLERADRAMYDAKSSGKHQFRLFNA